MRFRSCVHPSPSIAAARRSNENFENPGNQCDESDGPDDGKTERDSRDDGTRMSATPDHSQSDGGYPAEQHRARSDEQHAEAAITLHRVEGEEIADGHRRNERRYHHGQG